MKSSHKATITGLNEEIQNRESTILDLREQLKDADSRVLSLKEEIGQDQTKIEKLEHSLSDLHTQRTQLKARLDELQSTHDAIVSNLKNEIQNKEVTIGKLEEKLSITFVDRILFASGKAIITPEGKRVLTKVGNVLKNIEARQIRVVGHTDNKPIVPEYRHKYPSNWELSAARAAAVVHYFQESIGLDPGDMEAVGRSFYEPIASNFTEEGRAQNRRVNIIIGPRKQ